MSPGVGEPSLFGNQTNQPFLAADSDIKIYLNMQLLEDYQPSDS